MARFRSSKRFFLADRPLRGDLPFCELVSDSATGSVETRRLYQKTSFRFFANRAAATGFFSSGETRLFVLTRPLFLHVFSRTDGRCIRQRASPGTRTKYVRPTRSSMAPTKSGLDP